eukprot:2294371-Pyramimonas_sp.AAC.1
MTGHDFFLAKESDIQEELEQLAREKCAAILPGEGLNFAHCLTASQSLHLRIAREVHQKSCAKKRDRGEEPGDLLCDLEHHPDKRCRVSTTGSMMSQLRHGTIWSDAAERALVGSEILAMQGFPTNEVDDSHPCPLPWSPRELGLSSHALYKLMGNGMHMHILVAMWCWVLSCMEVQSEAPGRGQSDQDRSA